jgi:hypothetical protein
VLTDALERRKTHAHLMTLIKKENMMSHCILSTYKKENEEGSYNQPIARGVVQQGGPFSWYAFTIVINVLMN